ncbi:T9SS type A sorting domain-containing protein [Rhodothermus profundi]|uniref:Por secretion system C-terminal sorting domain-containing protein n=1 Tax=Rhodothermus profundi TaxID=633813 RepID=A0A1M6VCQ3_9BACT|nr:T9SS type A sorting domain-containing protein [Rhodothermus profundi]SHK79250.1 Por secretion system C-terminal sorting domain-containing protein [Rhodothermus profundi]
MQYCRRSLLALFSSFILAGIGALIIVSEQLHANEEVVVVLPIEVIGPDGYTVAVEVYVSDTTGVDSMYLKAHALGYTYTPALEDTGGYDKKASFRINGGPWIPIDNAHFKAFYPEARMYAPPLTGPIGGPYRTLRGMISIRGTGKLRPGRNTIEFRFNKTEGLSSGYRVLALDLRRGGRNGQSVLQGTRFVWDDPAQWGPPAGYDSPAAIAEGERLWKSRHILIDNPTHPEPIVAACADCHAESGFDLKYFNFSNRSIIERAKFHGLTEEEGKKIAAYIRSVDLQLPAGETVSSCGGRPWDPPYQPGPGLSKRPVECWAAGAGRRWVLDSDQQMLAFLAPSARFQAVLDALQGVPDPDLLQPEADLSWTNVSRYWRLDSTLVLADIPVSFELPDIFAWWPQVYPGDFFPEDVWHNSTYYQNYLTIKRLLAEKGPDFYVEQQRKSRNSGKWDEGLAQLFQRYNFRLNPKHNPHDDLNPPPEWGGRYPKDPRGRIMHIAVARWFLMKMWELQVQYKLEDRYADVYGDNLRGLSMQKADRALLLTGPWLMDQTMHRLSKNEKYSAAPFPTKVRLKYEDLAWWHLATILTPRLRTDNPSGGAIDWSYIFEVSRNALTGYGRNHTVGHLYYVLASMQAHASWYAEEGFTPGWGTTRRNGMRNLKVSTPLVWFGSHYMPVGFRALSRDTLRLITENLLRAWFIEAARYDLRHWQTLYGKRVGGSNGIEPPETVFDVPKEKCTADGHPSTGVNLSDWKNRAFMQYLYNAQCLGVRPTLLDSVARFWETISPGGNWERFFLNQEGTPTSAEGKEARTFEVKAPYPNPAVRKVTFPYTLPQTLPVRLEIYDLLGRRVAVVVDAVQPAGRHRVPFDVQALASGRYVFRLQAGPYSASRTLIVQK